MEYNQEKREIVLERELSNLDRLVLSFIKILEEHAEYVIISGYVSILLGRSRTTEDVDLFIKKMPFEKFAGLYKELKKNGFWCINAERAEEIFPYLEKREAVRFAKEGKTFPNFKVKFPKRRVDEDTFRDFLTVILKEGELKISSLERQIAFKRYYLESDKDVEDAVHIEEVFKEKIDKEKINKLKKIIDSIKEDEKRKTG